MPGRNVGGVKLTDEEYHRYIELQGKDLRDPETGKNLKETLEFIIEHPEAAYNQGMIGYRYDQMTEGTEGGKALIINMVIQEFRKHARLALREEFPELDQLIRDIQEEKVEALTGAMP